MSTNYNKIPEFAEELRCLLNRYSMENDSNTPDWVLAKYLISCLMAYNETRVQRNELFDLLISPRMIKKVKK